MPRCVARGVQGDQVPVAGPVGRRPQLDAVPFVEQPGDDELVAEGHRRPGVGPDRHAVAVGADRRRADVVGVVVRQDDRGQATAAGRSASRMANSRLARRGRSGRGRGGRPSPRRRGRRWCAWPAAGPWCAAGSSGTPGAKKIGWIAPDRDRGQQRGQPLRQQVNGQALDQPGAATPSAATPARPVSSGPAASGRSPTSRRPARPARSPAPGPAADGPRKRSCRSGRR